MLPEQFASSQSSFSAPGVSLLPPGAVCLLPEHVCFLPEQVCILPEQFASSRSIYSPPGAGTFFPEQVSSSRSSLGRGGHLQYTVKCNTCTVPKLPGHLPSTIQAELSVLPIRQQILIFSTFYSLNSFKNDGELTKSLAKLYTVGERSV